MVQYTIGEHFEFFVDGDVAHSLINFEQQGFCGAKTTVGPGGVENVEKNHSAAALKDLLHGQRAAHEDVFHSVLLILDNKWFTKQPVSAATTGTSDVSGQGDNDDVHKAADVHVRKPRKRKGIYDERMAWVARFRCGRVGCVMSMVVGGAARPPGENERYCIYVQPVAPCHHMWWDDTCPAGTLQGKARKRTVRRLKARKNAFDGLSTEELDRGDLTQTGKNAQVLRTVRFEMKSDLRGDADQEKSLVNLQRQWRDEEVEHGNLVGNAALHTGFIHNIRVGLLRSVDPWMRASIAIYRERRGAPTGISSDYMGGLVRGKLVADDERKTLNGMLSVATEDSV